MLLPWMWIRKRWLDHAMRDYPLYDPPHKIEERLLSKAQASENFDYFMRVRQQRAAFFQGWLRRYFLVVTSPSKGGIRSLNRWSNRYSGLLIGERLAGVPSYFSYDPPWEGKNVGCNVLFDLGITVGEQLIANCPRLHWDVDLVSPGLSRAAQSLKRAPGMSIQRPELASADNPLWRWSPLHDAYTFAHQMRLYVTTFRGLRRFLRRHRADRRRTREDLVTSFDSVLAGYPSFELDEPK